MKVKFRLKTHFKPAVQISLSPWSSLSASGFDNCRIWLQTVTTKFGRICGYRGGLLLSEMKYPSRVIVEPHSLI